MASHEEATSKPNLEEYRIHTVDKRDTLLGLSLKYGISQDAIRRCNDMPTDNLATFKTLQIPLTKEYKMKLPVGEGESHAAMLRKFRVTNDLSEPEARAYLELAEWNLEQAQAFYVKDVAFERAHGADLNAFLAEATAPTAVSTQSSTQPLNADAFEIDPAAGEETALLDSKEPVRSSGVQLGGGMTQPVRRRTHTADPF